MADTNPGFSGSNPYLDSTVDSVLGDITRNYNLSIAPAWTTAMVRSGSFGNSGVQQMQQEDQRQLQQSLGRAATDMRYSDYWNNQNLNRNLYNDAFSQNQQQLGNLPGLLSMLGGANSQDLTNATTVQNAPLNYYQQFANMSNGIANGFGTTSGSVNMPGNPLLGAMAGAKLGGDFAQAMWPTNSWGNSVYNPTSDTGGWMGTSLGDFYHHGTGGTGD